MTEQLQNRMLEQVEVDQLTIHLEESEITNETVGTLLRNLDDLEYGRGVWPDDWRPYCKKCDEQIEDSEMMGVAMGSYYHDKCVPGLARGPLPLGQYLGGAADQ